MYAHPLSFSTVVRNRAILGRNTAQADVLDNPAISRIPRIFHHASWNRGSKFREKAGLSKTPAGWSRDSEQEIQMVAVLTCSIGVLISYTRARLINRLDTISDALLQ